MAKSFHLTIAKIGENLFDDDALSASMPGTEGVFEILADHEAFVSELREGTVRVKVLDGRTLEFSVSRGIAEVSSGQATILL